jgi:putative SOS response-associated peptidase YedK
MRPVNAKAETVAQSPMFGDSLRQRRCLVVADGFFESRTVAKKKQPVWFHLKDNAPFAFAGIWDVRTVPRPGVMSQFSGKNVAFRPRSGYLLPIYPTARIGR